VTRPPRGVRLATGRRAPTYVGDARELFHIAMPEDWARAQLSGAVTDSTRGVTLAQEGYIHCSFTEQVAATARRFYGDVPRIVLLRIDPAAINCPIVVEDLVGSGVEFPHVYGPIDVAAVVEATTVAPDQIRF
jgi:uncharacterized protein (DUF952 family)